MKIAKDIQYDLDRTENVAVQCLIKGDGCKEGFPKTDETLTEKFKGFYKG